MPIDNKRDMKPIEVCKMLMSKAGYKGFVTHTMIRTAVFMRFTTTKTEMSFDEYREIARQRKEEKR